jgi:hypothetical protein
VATEHRTALSRACSASPERVALREEGLCTDNLVTLHNGREQREGATCSVGRVEEPDGLGETGVEVNESRQFTWPPIPR